MCCVASFFLCSGDRFSREADDCDGGLDGAGFGFGAGAGLLTGGGAAFFAGAGGGAGFFAGALGAGAAFFATGFAATVFFAAVFFDVDFFALTARCTTFFVGADFFFAATCLRAGARDAFLALFFLVAMSSPRSAVAPSCNYRGSILRKSV